MAIGAYTKTTWANSPATTSAVSAANLQHVEDQVKDITDAAVSGGASPTKIWTSTNDGNGGQPPAPKPGLASGTAIGAWRAIGSRYVGGASSGIPGTWAGLWWNSSGILQDSFVDAGSTDLGATCASIFCWRIA